MHLNIEETIEYCRNRQTFDMPLINNQYIHFKLAELQSEVELLRSLIYRAAGTRYLRKARPLNLLSDLIILSQMDSSRAMM